HGVVSAAHAAPGSRDDRTGPGDDRTGPGDDGACACTARPDAAADHSADHHRSERAVGCDVVSDALLSIDEAIDLILARVTLLETEAVPLGEAAGRVTAEPARSAVDLPPFPSSAMDGFALRAADTPGTLPVVARVAAGRPAPRPLAA